MNIYLLPYPATGPCKHEAETGMVYKLLAVRDGVPEMATWVESIARDIDGWSHGLFGFVGYPGTAEVAAAAAFADHPTVRFAGWVK